MAAFKLARSATIGLETAVRMLFTRPRRPGRGGAAMTFGAAAGRGPDGMPGA
jgi:hypothetical protein